MKIKDGFMLRQIADSWIVLPVGDDNSDFTGVLTLNGSGAMLWKFLETDCQVQTLVDALTSEYDVTAEQAAVDVQEFLDKLRKAGCLD